MIKINVSKSDINLPKYAHKQLARYSKVTKLGMKCFFEAPNLSISGMAVASDNKMFFVDNFYQTYHLIDTAYKLLHWNHITEDKVRLRKTILHDVCTMKNNNAAISVPKEKELYFISCRPKVRGITGEVRTKYEPVALCGLRNGDIAVSWDKPVGFWILTFHQSFSFDEKVYFDRDQSGRIMKSFQYMAIDEDRSPVIQPCTIDKAVFCFDFAGVPKFTFKDPDLTRPMGVTIDQDGAIYVCNWDRNNIHILSPSGEPARIMRQGVPDHPVLVLYKRKSNELVVATDTKPYAGVCVLKLLSIQSEAFDGASKVNISE